MRIVKKLMSFVSLAVLLVGCAEPVTKECGTTDVTTLAGGTLGYADGTGAAAKFYSPHDVVTDGTNLYVSDTRNDKIRKVVIATGEVSTLATVSHPEGMTIDGGYLYVADVNANIQKVAIATGEVTQLTLTAPIGRTYGMATDSTHLYLAERGMHRISKVVIATGEVIPLAGSGAAGFADGTGTAAQFGFPADVELDADGTSLYVADMDNKRIRKVVIATGEVTTLAGTGEDGVDDGEGSAAKFSSVMGLVRDGGALYVSDYGNNRIRKVEIATGKVTTLIGVKDDGELFHGPFGITKVGSASDADGLSLYVMESYNDRARKIHHVPGECADDTKTQVSVSGTVTGLTATLVLQNNGASDTTITENGSFDFEVASGAAYDITVKIQPNGQVCAVYAGQGSVPQPNLVVVSCEASATPPIDATPPAVPTIVDLRTVDRQPVLTGTFDATELTAGGMLMVTVNGHTFRQLEGYGSDIEMSASGNDWTLTMPQAMAVGTYDITATAMDAAGNTSTASGILEVVEPPPAPTVATATTQDPTPTLSGTFDAANSTGGFSVGVNNTTYTSGTDPELTTNGNSWNLNVPQSDALPTGTHNVTATSTDGTGKQTTTTTQLVVGSTTSPTNWSLEDHYTNDTTPTIRGTFPTDAGSFNLKLGRSHTQLSNGGSLWWFYAETRTDPEQGDVLFNTERQTQGIVGSFDRVTGEWQLTISKGLSESYQFTDGLSEGTYLLELVNGPASYWSPQVGSAKLVVDLTAPAAPTVTSQTTADTTPTITGTFDAADADVFTVAVNNVTYTLDTDSALTSSGDTWSLTIPGANALTGGTYDVVASVTDKAGNASSDTTTNELVVDATVPSTPTLVSLTTNSTTPTITGTFDSADAAGGLSVTVNGVTYTLGVDAALTNSGNTWTLIIPAGSGLTEDAYDVVVVASDAVGNTGTATGTAGLVVDLTPPALPTVTTLSTASTTPTISGTFDSADAEGGFTVTVNSATYTLGAGTGLTNSGDTWSLTIPTGSELPSGTFNVAATATDKAGNAATDNTTDELVVAGDETAPEVASGGITPADGATGVARNSTITAAFNEDMFATTINSTNFTLAGSSSVSGTVSFDGSTTATFTPDSNLGMLTQYTATLTTGITDLAGNPLASNQTWSFTTADGAWGTTPATVDISAEDNNSARVVVDEQGNATAVWLQFDGSINSVVANRYAPGTGWGASPALLESATGNASGVELAVDASGNVFAVWQQPDGGAVTRIWVSRYDASSSSWSTAVQLDSDTSDAGSAQVAVDGSGNAIVVWNQSNGSLNNIWASRYSSGSWSAAAKIEADDSTDATAPAIAMDADGNAIVVWHLGDGFTTGDIKATHYTNGAWVSTPVALETRVDTDIGFSAQVAMDSNGNAIAVWGQADDGGNFNIWANRYDAGTGNWGTAAVIADGTGNGSVPQVSMDASGNAMAVWVQDNGNDVWSSRFTVSNTSWGTAEKLDNLAGTTSSPQIAMDATGHGVAVWFQTDDGGRDSTFANRYVNGTGWGTAAVIETDDTYDSQMYNGPAGFGMNSKGEAMAVWHQMQSSGKYDLWANSFK